MVTVTVSVDEGSDTFAAAKEVAKRIDDLVSDMDNVTFVGLKAEQKTGGKPKGIDIFYRATVPKD